MLSEFSFLEVGVQGQDCLFCKCVVVDFQEHADTILLVVIASQEERKQFWICQSLWTKECR
jgi:hypothetical protein